VIFKMTMFFDEASNVEVMEKRFDGLDVEYGSYTHKHCKS